MPVPGGAAAKALFGVQTALMEIDVVAQELANRVQEAGEEGQAAEGFGVGMGAKGKPD